MILGSACSLSDSLSPSFSPFSFLYTPHPSPPISPSSPSCLSLIYESCLTAYVSLSLSHPFLSPPLSGGLSLRVSIPFSLSPSLFTVCVSLLPLSVSAHLSLSFSVRFCISLLLPLSLFVSLSFSVRFCISPVSYTHLTLPTTASV